MKTPDRTPGTADYDIEDVCRRVVAGESIHKIAADHLVDEMSLRNWIRRDKDRSEMYDQARRDRADRIADEINELAEAGMEVEGRFIQGYRNAIDAKKWLAAKYYPRMYGDRQQLDIEAKVETTPDEKVAARLAELLAQAARSGTD